MIQKIHPTIRNPHGEKIDTSYHPGNREKVLIILGHGLTGHKDRPVIASLAEALSLDGWPCLRLSYSGNGLSEGSFTDSNITKNIADLTAVMDQVSNGKKVIYIGHSMGSAVGALTAVRDERIAGLVSLAGLVHTHEFAERTFPELLSDQQKLIDDLTQIHSILPAVKELRLPWLLFHGLKDDEVFPKDSEDLVKTYRGKNKFVLLPDGDHLFEKDSSIIAKETLEWLNKYFL